MRETSTHIKNTVVSLFIAFMISACGSDIDDIEVPSCLKNQIPVVGSSMGFCIAFKQADREADDGVELNSPVGVVELDFESRKDILHFNLNVNKAQKIINFPIVSDRESSRTRVQFSFDLGVNAGTDVTQLEFIADLSAESRPPLPGNAKAQTARVESSEYIIVSGEQNEILNQDDLPVVLDGGGGAREDTEGHSNSNFPNQEAGKNECVPAAVSNSMQFLNEKHQLNLSEDQISIATWKEALGWRETGTRTGWWDPKDQHLAANNYGISTTTSTKVEDAMAALDNNCDVEIRVKGHVAALVQITETKNEGNYSIGVAHDTRQGKPGGNTRVDMGRLNTRYSRPGTIRGVWGMRGKKLGVFVIECPANGD